MTLTAVIRTIAQGLVTFILGVGWVADLVAALTEFGIVIDPVVLEGGVFILLLGGVTGFLNWLGKRFPVVNKILSLGRSPGTPAYIPPAPKPAG